MKEDIYEAENFYSNIIEGLFPNLKSMKNEKRYYIVAVKTSNEEIKTEYSSHNRWEMQEKCKELNHIVHDADTQYFAIRDRKNEL